MLNIVKLSSLIAVLRAEKSVIMAKYFPLNYQTRKKEASERQRKKSTSTIRDTRASKHCENKIN